MKPMYKKSCGKKRCCLSARLVPCVGDAPPRKDAMTIDGSHVIIVVYLIVSVGVIVALVLTLGGGLDSFVDRLSKRRRRDRESR